MKIPEQFDFFSCPDPSPKENTYDILFIINLLNQIEYQLNKGKFSPQDTLFSLRESCKSLRIKLEMEKDFSNKPRVKSYRCEKCGEMYFVLKFNKISCPACEEKQNTKRISNF
jgi:DNA-directed RNA polymerase subunit RPC12/RpoP